MAAKPLLLAALILGWPWHLERPYQEVGFLDLETAGRAEGELQLVMVSLSGATGIVPVQGFHLTLLSPGFRKARRGEPVELQVVIQNIAQEALAIPWETNWQAVLGKVPGDSVKEFPEGYTEGDIRAYLQAGTAAPEAPGERLQLSFDGVLYGCRCKPGTLLDLAPGQSARIRAVAKVPQEMREGEWRLVIRMSFSTGLDSVHYLTSVESEPVCLDIVDR